MAGQSGVEIRRRGLVAAAGLLALAACGDGNKYQAPPAPEVKVQLPIARKITLFTEHTGSTSAFNKVELVARVQGFLEKANFRDGDSVKKDQVLFEIERAPYETSLQIAEAGVAQQEALLAQAEADLGRQTALSQRQIASDARFEDAQAKRRSVGAALEQAKGQVQQARINLGYTQIKAPFDGIVTARLVDPGTLVGAGGPTRLATLLQIEPTYVIFSVNELQVLRIRSMLREQGLSIKDIGPIPVEIGLQTDQGYPHTGRIDYISPELDPATGTLSVRAVVENKGRQLLPGLFVRVRVPVQRDIDALLVPETALGNDQRGRYLLIVDAGGTVEQRPVEVGDETDGGLRVIKSGVKATDRVIVGGAQRAVPGSRVRIGDQSTEPARAKS